GRLAAMMGVPLVKVNVEPALLVASIRTYDLRPGQVEVCPECQLTEEQYTRQRHPASCDGGSEQPTGRPRALCQGAAGAAALALAQVVGCPERLARRWFGRQWLLPLVGGQSSWSLLTPKPDCRWEHGRHWQQLRRLEHGPERITLADLLRESGWQGREDVRLRFSAPVATQARCQACGEGTRGLWW